MPIDLSKINIVDEPGQDRDVLPGQRAPRVQESGAYPVRIDLAYMQDSPGGATAVVLHFEENVPGGFKHRETVYFTRRDGTTQYQDKRTGEMRNLPGLNILNNLTKLLADKSLNQVQQEEKVIKLWDFDQMTEVPTKKQVLTELIGKELTIGLQKKRANKREQDANGKWVPTAEERLFNEVDKYFNKDGQTLTEQGAKEPGVFIDKWKAANEGKTKDEYVPVAGATPQGTGGNGAASPTPASPPAGASKPLFSD